MKKYWLKTFGCQLNQADSERLVLALNQKDYQLVERPEEADLIIINSCLVRESAENRVYGLINNLFKIKKQKAKIVLTGCLAGWAKNDASGKNLRILRKKIGDEVEITPILNLIKPYNMLMKSVRSDKKKQKEEWAKVPISRGCNQFCSYCIVPYARGRESHRPAQKILAEINCFLERGYQKILLLGQNVNSWQGQGKIKNFPQLLAAVAQIKGIQEVSFLSANPWDFSDQLIEVIADHPKISRTIHLPLQSGDDQILKRMNRPYRAQDYLQLVTKIRKKIPGAVITTDLIVGFPGETEAAFQNTVKLCQKIGFQRAFIAKYSPRPGTVASKLYPDNVSPQEKKRRWWILEKLINQKIES